MYYDHGYGHGFVLVVDSDGTYVIVDPDAPDYDDNTVDVVFLLPAGASPRTPERRPAEGWSAW